MAEREALQVLTRLPFLSSTGPVASRTPDAQQEARRSCRVYANIRGRAQDQATRLQVLLLPEAIHCPVPLAMRQPELDATAARLFFSSLRTHQSFNMQTCEIR